jgi:FkbM family methyltransferase
MNLDFKINSISSDGVIDFLYLGDEIPSSHEISIIDANTGLTVHKSKMNLKRDASYWISTGSSNAKRLKNVIFNISYENMINSLDVELSGESRYLVVNSKKVSLNHLGDDLFPIVTEIFYDKVYERDYVRVSIGDVVVDIGANYGIFSLYSMNFKPSAIFALEPIKKTFKCLKNNLLGYNVTCISKAISNVTGFEMFNITDVNGNNFSVKNSDGFHPSEVKGEELVETTTINDFIKDYNIKYIDFLKVDCEGGELDLFQTIDEDFLKTKIHKIVIEYHSDKIKNIILEKLKSCGFKIEDTVGSKEIGLIYSYNPKYTKSV